jgi:hypothetical protein
MGNTNSNKNLRKTASQIGLNHSKTTLLQQNNGSSTSRGIENYFNAMSQLGSSSSATTGSLDLVKDMPSLKSFAGSLNYDGDGSLKEIEKQIKGKWKMEQAMNNKQILMPHDSRGLVMIYGGAKDKEE